MGGALSATAGEAATITDPSSGHRLTTKVSATNNGRRWGGMGLLGSGAVLALLGLRVF